MARKTIDIDYDADIYGKSKLRSSLEESSVEPPSYFSTQAIQPVNAIAKVENKEVRSKAEEEVSSMLQKIVSSQKKLEEYQADVEKAKQIKNNLFNRSKIEEQRRINEQHIAEILQEQNDLIKGGITLTIATIEFASYLGESLARMIDDGFKTRDGHFQRLTGQTRELARSLLMQVKGMETQMKEAEKTENPS